MPPTTIEGVQRIKVMHESAPDSSEFWWDENHTYAQFIGDGEFILVLDNGEEMVVPVGESDTVLVTIDGNGVATIQQL